MSPDVIVCIKNQKTAPLFSVLGKCRELLCMLVMVTSAGGEIFTNSWGWPNPMGLARRLYDDKGIERVLKDILRKPGWVVPASNTLPISSALLQKSWSSRSTRWQCLQRIVAQQQCIGLAACASYVVLTFETWKCLQTASATSQQVW